ncbi:hypothetical protein AB0J28_16850 [Streptosporangium canum]|uniref:hypothetical protein n=1 Tax=Streptosporangium canum TaxID=324952 RepID=UPI0034195FC6
MSPPDMKKDGGGAITPAHRPNDQKAANTTSTKVQPQANGRSNRGGQTALPSFVPAEALIPSPGRAKVALIVHDCPRCGGEHIHRCEDPAPPVLTRKAGCGARYDVYPYRLKATKRGRRAA